MVMIICEKIHMQSGFTFHSLIHIAIAGCGGLNINVPERESLCIQLQYTQISISESGIVQVQGHHGVAALMQIASFSYEFISVASRKYVPTLFVSTLRRRTFFLFLFGLADPSERSASISAPTAPDKRGIFCSIVRPDP